MTNKTEIVNLKHDLLHVLPVALHDNASALAALIIETLAGDVTPAAAEQRLAADPMLTATLQALAEQPLADGAITIQLIEPEAFSTPSQPQDATIRIISTGGGDYAEGNIDKRNGTFIDLHFHSGESADVRLQKRARARSMLIDDILAQIGNLDARLAFVAVARTADMTEQRLAALRQKIAPATAQIVASSYRQLIATQNIATLRQAFNSRPLAASLSSALVALVAETDADVDGIGFFYDQLAQSLDAAESLLALLTEVAGHGVADASVAAYDEQRIDLAIWVLHNRSQTAYIVGLRTLRALMAAPAAVEPVLALLGQLEPRQLVDGTIVTQLLNAFLTDAARLMAERAALVAIAEQLREQAFDSYAQLEELLTIQPSDSWHVVVGKARSLRDLGRIADAVAAFGRYAEMFSPADATAAEYASMAQQFTGAKPLGVKAREL